MPPSVDTIWMIAICAFVALTGGAIAYRKVTLRIAADRMKEIAAMHVYRKRLETVMSELLARANELDQAAKYLPADKAARVSDNVGKVCEELVRLGETLPLLDQLLQSENVKESKDGILRTCRMASKISADMKLVEEQELKLIGYNKTAKKPHGTGPSG